MDLIPHLQTSFKDVKLIFIIPFRNRETHLNVFSTFMKYIMEDYKENEVLYLVCNQKDTRPFNRGAMKNLGFMISKYLFPERYKEITFVFHDIDTMPSRKNMISYETEEKKIKHFYGFQFALGGIFSIQGKDFEDVGGFPNIWGWGYEDNIIQSRVIEKKMTIDRSQFYVCGHTDIAQLQHGKKRVIDQKVIYKVNTWMEHSYFYDIKNIEYTVRPMDLNTQCFYLDFIGWNIPQRYEDIEFRMEVPKPKLTQFKFDMRTILRKQYEKNAKYMRKPMNRRYR